MTLAEQLRNLLKKARLDSAQLSQRSGINPVQIHSYLRGSHIPNLRNARKLAKALGVGLEAFNNVVLPQDAKARSKKCSRMK
jgi:transcriptional regulator with XRE-family HTH domain